MKVKRHTFCIPPTLLSVDCIDLETKLTFFRRQSEVLIINFNFSTGHCNEPLGMESGAIPDEAITASSSYVPNVGPRNGR